MEAISSQHLHEAGLFSQTLHPFLISAVGERLIRLLTLFAAWTAGCAEDGLVPHIVAPLDWLAVHPWAYPERKNHSRGDFGEQESAVVASESDEMGDHAK